MTNLPTMEIVVDLGDAPRLSEVARYFEDLSSIYNYALTIYLPNSVARMALRVVRVRMSSPLETVLAASSSFQPVAAVVAALWAVERAIRLLMEWQMHQLELAGRRSGGSGEDREDDDLEALLERQSEIASSAIDALEQGAGSGGLERAAEGRDAALSAARRIIRYRVILVEVDADAGKGKRRKR
ncbi:hypothetical protein O7623_00065 [Solwaraspora sp. WMMD791]|uniref:hypothetical protein n=1 Tax=Solwaraspora sp. WMMD791 TaxID=3016086 RepID=UPI00249A1CCB|nr:hypothetical protein [Solwaraspora sp. WMMD791]WFE27643.1 hypothetical protein O7623_31300 [Solwaraspora sp. WMMD791]WFE27656.1 hypothetical protein O7623_00065 [Solwaraspora sp. WMMD791]